MLCRPLVLSREAGTLPMHPGAQFLLCRPQVASHVAGARDGAPIDPDTVVTALFKHLRAAVDEAGQLHPPAKERARQALSATAKGSVSISGVVVGHCSSALCPPAGVRVTMQDGMCVASVTIGLIRIPENDVVDVQWELLTRGPCAAPNQCRFDDPTGITVLTNQGIKFGSPAVTPTRVRLTHLKGSPIKMPIADYEPHVWLTKPDGTSVTCCPIDPKMINDN